MKNKLENKLFIKFNDVSKIERCPNGKGPLKKELNDYAKAAINLYGIVLIKEFVELYNSHNKYKVSEGEVLKLLLPYTIKENNYCFYDGYIICLDLIENLEYFNYIVNSQADKPLYMPSKNEFLKYLDISYEGVEYSKKENELKKFFMSTWNDVGLTYEVLMCLECGHNPVNFIESNAHRMPFENQAQVQQLIGLYTDAQNHKRQWENKGYSPTELFEKEKSKVHKPVFLKNERTKVNDPCPCGSGKKYKKCCMIVASSVDTKLNADECELFYVIWYGLLGYVNKVYKIIDKVILPKYPNTISDEELFDVRETLWKNPDIILEYIDSTSLEENKVSILKSWHSNHIKDRFIVMKHNTKFTELFSFSDSETIYGVKGITNSIPNVLKVPLPTVVSTVLLPFNDKIVYDSFMGRISIEFDNNTISMFQDTYESGVDKGVITKL